MVSAVRPVTVYGLLSAVKRLSPATPSSTLICHCVALPFSVHDRVAVVAVTAVHVTAVGVATSDSSVVKVVPVQRELAWPSTTCTRTT